MLARCRVHEVSQEWGCEWGSSYMNESIHSVSSHDCRFLRSRMRGASLLITPSLEKPLELDSLELDSHMAEHVWERLEAARAHVR